MFIEIFNTSFAYLNNQIIGNIRNYISDANLNNEDFEILLCEFNYHNFETHNWKSKIEISLQFIKFCHQFKNENF